MSNRRIVHVGFLFVLLACMHLYVWNLYPRYQSPNVLSRVYLTLAIVDHGTFQIDEPLKRYSTRGDVRDKAVHEGRYYTDKAPGGSWLLAPSAWFLRRIGGVSVDELDRMIYGLRVLGLSLPATLFWIWSWRLFRDVTGEALLADAVVLAGALGTNFLIYSTQLYSHAVAGMLLFIALTITSRPELQRADFISSRRACLAGSLAGAALIVDYLTAFAIPVLFFLSLDVRFKKPWRDWDWRAGIALFWGAVPLLSANLWYNQICFGDPFRVGFHAHADPEFAGGYQAGLFGMIPPSLEAAEGMLFSPDRGMLFLSPFLALAPIGWRRLSFHPCFRKFALGSLATALAIYLFALTTIRWRGGWSVGSRYLVPAVPFVLVGVAGALRQSLGGGLIRILFAASAGVAVLLVTTIALTFPQFPELVDDPIFDLAIPMLRANQVSDTVATPWLGSWSAAPMLALAIIAVGWILSSVGGDGVLPRFTGVTASLLLGVVLLMTEQYFGRKFGDEGLADESRGAILLLMGRDGEAKTLLAAAKPRTASLQYAVGVQFAQSRDYPAAQAAFERVLTLNPAFVDARGHLAHALIRLGRAAPAISHYRLLVEQLPIRADLANDLAWLLATWPDDKIRNGAEAQVLAQRACEQTNWRNIQYLDTLAAAHAELGEFDRALDATERALRLAKESHDKAAVSQLTARREQLQKKQPVREPSCAR